MDDKIITLNVGGKIFQTCKSTLVKAEYFKSLFEGQWKDKETDEFFIDDDPELFRHILLQNKLNLGHQYFNFSQSKKQPVFITGFR